MLTSALVALLGIAAQALLGPENVNSQANNPEYWTGASVLYAEVISVENREFERNGRHLYADSTIHLRPIASLSGDIDPAFQGDVRAETRAGGSATTVITSVPGKGSRVIVLLQHGGNMPTPLSIPTGDVSFFPNNKTDNQPAIFEVTGFDDPKVTETIENLRKLRGKQREEAEKAKAEQKAAAEKKSPQQSPPAK